MNIDRVELCERSLPNDQETYNNIQDKVTYICGQLEATESGKLHVQMYMQFKDRQTQKSAKTILRDDSISFSVKLGGNSQQNRDYAMKTYNHCK